MKILFLAHTYFDLYKPILEEMQRQGHSVYMIEDIPLKYDYNSTEISNLRKLVCRLKRTIYRVENNYWNNKIKADSHLSERYDFLFCIQGLSFSPVLYKHLKKKNPDLKSVLYVWDTAKYYNFYRYTDCFDHFYTFDLYDTKTIDGLELLPSYWVPQYSESPNKYLLTMVGSDHDDRLEIISKIIPQLDKYGKPYYIKVVLNPCKIDKQKYPLEYKKAMALQEQKAKMPYTTFEVIPVKNVMKLINSSSCILDTDKPIQTGATQRVIWALAHGKKVLSTNSYLREMPFYDASQIQIIDRENPIIDFSFFDEKGKPNTQYFEQLRIDNWVRKILL